MTDHPEMDLVVTIVPRGNATEVRKAGHDAGAEGCTILHGIGTGIHERKKLMGVRIMPEKDIVLTLVPRAIADTVVEAIVAAAELNHSGTGLCFTVPADRIHGIHRNLPGEGDGGGGEDDA